MLQVIIFSLIGGVLSLSGAIALISKQSTSRVLAAYATPFAAGVLLAAAFTDLLPEALHGQTPRSILTAALAGVLGFFLLERFIRVFHHHHVEDQVSKGGATNSLIIIGDTLHNALDGIAIGAAFLIDPSTGIVAALAVAAHEIPQEIGDFGMLLANGMKRSRVVVFNILSALATTVTAVITYRIGFNDATFIPYLLAITAGFFIYIAASDIIPEIHEHSDHSKLDIRPWLLIAGALFVLIASPIAHNYIDAGHTDEHTMDSYTDDEVGDSDHDHADDHVGE